MKFLVILALMAPMAFAQGKDPGVQTFKIDPSHTSIVFKVDHMGFSNVYGMFDGGEGSFTINEAKPDQSAFEITVKADTLNTYEKKRDEHLKGPDFFNVKQYPNIVLKSKSVKKTSANEYLINGDLTLHGVTKPVTFTFKHNKTGLDPWGKMRSGGDTSFTLKRSDYGMTFMSKPGEVGNEVTLMVAVEGVKE